MELGFVIDQRRCIGCHACTVACKAENDVPLGEFRTWVKYTEKGTFPQVRRHFTVLRCNHCDAAPCVEICPVVALHKRPDAIVDLDRDVCIGCRACMQACPYDALYLNPHTGTAEKCHFCAHRTELGLEPACVIVCPEEAIVAGDVADPGSRIARLIREQPTERRKLEKGTQPRVWYVDALAESLTPGAAAEPEMWLWSDRRRAPQPVPGWEQPLDLRTTLNVDHPPAWGWHIWLYLWTKNVAAGLMLLAPFYAWLGVPDGGGALPEVFALFFLGLTGFLLVHDLGRPGRFLNILFHPNPRSWLVKGTWALMGFGALTAGSFLFQVQERPELSQLLRWLNLPFAALASGYTAFLFAQCRGRDLWLEKGQFLQLVLQAAALGGLFGLVLQRSAPDPGLFAPAAVAAAALAFANLALTYAKLRGAKASVPAAKARDLMLASKGLIPAFTGLGAAAVAGALAMLNRGSADGAMLGALGFLALSAGLLLYEREFVNAGQEVPIS